MKFKYFLPIIIGLSIGAILKLFIFDIVRVSGTSMEPSIHENSIVIINKLAYGVAKPFGSELLFQWAQPKKNDIVIYVINNKVVVKRCVAISGEALDFSSDSQYTMYIGEKEIPLTEQQFQRIKFDNIVPDNTILAIGDNPKESVDSRDYGFIPTRYILGRVEQ